MTSESTDMANEESTYRKEALQFRYRSLYGAIILSGGQARWYLTCMLVLTLIATLTALAFLSIPTSQGMQPLYQWLWR